MWSHRNTVQQPVDTGGQISGKANVVLAEVHWQLVIAILIFIGNIFTISVQHTLKKCVCVCGWLWRKCHSRFQIYCQISNLDKHY